MFPPADSIGRANRMKAKILIVEDDPHILLGLEAVLKSEGYEVAACNRGDAAVEAVDAGVVRADQGREIVGRAKREFLP